MPGIGTVAPSLFWRALFVWFLAAGTARPQPSLPSAAEAARMIEQVRQADLPRDHYFEFELIALPKRGEEKTFRGRLWGSRVGDDPIKRVEIIDAQGRPQRLLLQRGARAAVWRWENGQVTAIASSDWFAPVVPGVELTAFDLQMPFLFWPEVALKGVTPIRGRDAHVFVFTAPPDFAAQKSQIAAVRVFLDTALNALVQTELLDRGNRVLKRFSPLSLKMVGRQTVPKAVDYRNNLTGDKARIQFTAVALELDLAPALFQPGGLGDEVPAPAKLVRLD